jgi:acyl CoA:acetate/3-ketoacid CoA transferase
VAFGEVDSRGDVNVSKLGGRAVGPGGFINITQNARRVVFCGTLTGGGLDVEVRPDGISIHHEGRYPKFVERVEHITFSARRSAQHGREVLYVTERAVFRLTDDGLELIEVAPGVDIERDVLARMGFRPAVATTVRSMDGRLFREGLMGRFEKLGGPAG